MLDHEGSQDVKCPSCGKQLDGWTSAGDAPRMNSGSLSLCIYCAGFGVYEVVDEELSLRSPTAEEYDEINRDPGLIRMVAAVHMAKKAVPPDA